MPAPRPTGTGYHLRDGRVSLDWSRKPEHWGGGRQRRCRFCRRLCLLVDDERRPVHKVCLEQALTAALIATAQRDAA